MVLSKYQKIKYCQYSVFNCVLPKGFLRTERRSIPHCGQLTVLENTGLKRVANYDINELFGHY